MALGGEEVADSINRTRSKQKNRIPAKTIFQNEKKKIADIDKSGRKIKMLQNSLKYIFMMRARASKHLLVFVHYLSQMQRLK